MNRLIAHIFPAPETYYQHELLIDTASKKLAKRRVGAWKRPSSLHIIGAILMLIGSVLAITNSLTNHQAIYEAEQAIDSGAPQAASTANGGAQDPNIVPSANKPSRDQVLAYSVAPHLPKRIEIPAIGVFARITHVGDTTDGNVGVPIDIYDSSWYNMSSSVGANPGSSVIVGHVGRSRLPGVFHNLHTLSGGEEITVVMGDDRVYRYSVTSLKEAHVSDIKMSDYLSYYKKPKPLLHLITCSGSVVPGTFSYDSRFIVSAELM